MNSALLRAWSRGPARQVNVDGFVVDAIAVGYADTRFTVALVIDGGEDVAKSIEAVPDLVEALQAIAQSWPAHGSGVVNATADAMASKARAALRKAGIR